MGSGWGRTFCSGPHVRQSSLYWFTWMLFYKTEIVFLLFLQYSQIWLQVSDKDITKGMFLSVLL